MLDRANKILGVQCDMPQLHMQRLRQDGYWYWHCIGVIDCVITSPTRFEDENGYCRACR